MTDVVEVYQTPAASVEVLTPTGVLLDVTPPVGLVGVVIDIQGDPTAIVEIPTDPMVVFDITPLPGTVTPSDPDTGVHAYAHTQALNATVWTITHNLAFDPAGIVVVSADGYVLDGFGVQYLSTGVSLRLSFDIAVRGVAYLS